MIKEILHKDDFQIYSELLNSAFLTVAKEFNLTRENSPTNNAFISAGQLKQQLTKNRRFFCYLSQNEPIGFIAIEKAENPVGTFYIEKLAVLPQYRHKGIGNQLMDFATKEIKEMGGELISIGLIDTNNILKDWYQRQGFIKTHVKSFDTLPFDVCYMEKKIG